ALAAPDPVMVGSNLTCTFTVRNQGPASATGVTLQHPLPQSLGMISVISSQGSCANQDEVITCALGELASGAVATVTVSAVPTVAGAITNTATVSGNEIDFNLANNVAVAVATARLATDLSLGVSIFPKPLQLFQQATY